MCCALAHTTHWGVPVARSATHCAVRSENAAPAVSRVGREQRHGLRRFIRRAPPAMVRKVGKYELGKTIGEGAYSKYVGRRGC